MNFRDEMLVLNGNCFSEMFEFRNANVKTVNILTNMF